MEQIHNLWSDTVRMGKRGQITIPKKIRDEDCIEEDDTFIVTHSPGGDILLRKTTIKSPEDTMVDIIRSLPKLDWRKMWTEVEHERSLEHR